jgi:putative addiction module antidote
MVRKIFKTGNSMVVSLPKDVLDSLRLAEGAEVDIQLDQERGVITIAPAPAHAAVRGVDEDLARQVREFIDQYRPALEALARA